MSDSKVREAARRDVEWPRGWRVTKTGSGTLVAVHDALGITLETDTPIDMWEAMVEAAVLLAEDYRDGETSMAPVVEAAVASADAWSERYVRGGGTDAIGKAMDKQVEAVRAYKEVTDEG